MEIRRQRKERSFWLLPAIAWQLLEVVGNMWKYRGTGRFRAPATKARQHLFGDPEPIATVLL